MLSCWLPSPQHRQTHVLWSFVTCLLIFKCYLNFPSNLLRYHWILELGCCKIKSLLRCNLWCSLCVLCEGAHSASLATVSTRLHHGSPCKCPCKLRGRKEDKHEWEKKKSKYGRMVEKAVGKQSLLPLPLHSLHYPVCIIMLIYMLIISIIKILFYVSQVKTSNSNK